MTLFLRSTIFAVLLLSRLWAWQPLIEIRTRVDTNRITIGDRIHYTVLIDHAPYVRVERPGDGVVLEPFEIKDYRFPKQEVLQGDRRRERFEFTLTVYDTGRFEIPAFPVLFYADSSDSGQIISGRAIPVDVLSVLGAGDSLEVRDIRSPLTLPVDWPFWGWMLLVVFMLLLAAWLVYRAWKNKQETGNIFRPPPPPTPAHEIALQALAELYRSDLLARGAHKTFYSRLSDILRAYLEGRYFIRALESTTDEILRDLKAHLPEGEINRVARILRVADLVKFAKHVPDKITTQNIMRETEQFVLDTKLVFEEPAEDDKTTPQPEQLTTKEEQP